MKCVGYVMNVIHSSLCSIVGTTVVYVVVYFVPSALQIPSLFHLIIQRIGGAGDKVRVCNYCFKQWKLDLAASESVNLSGVDLRPSPSNTGNSSAKNAGSMHRRDGDDGECGRSNNVYRGFNISFYDDKMRSLDIGPVDLENYQQLWFPPEPQDEREDTLFDNGDDEDATGKNRTRDLPGEEHKKAIKHVVDGHLRSLIAQHIQEENLTTGEENNKDSWLEIITSLSWEAATLLKPDTGEGGGMYPGEL
ncbi:uncharacterized protein A4U43_C08F27020 [Asparagus officinalis]|nr:uncharacterized protein A4U43_C08F27020 [Asparagus officinalis]